MIHFFDGPLHFGNNSAHEHLGKTIMLDKKILNASATLSGFEVKKKSFTPAQLHVEVWAEILNDHSAVVHGKPIPIKDTKCSRFNGTVKYTLMVVTED